MENNIGSQSFTQSPKRVFALASLGHAASSAFRQIQTVRHTARFRQCGNSRDVGKAGLSLLYFGSVGPGISAWLGSPERSEQSDFSRVAGTDGLVPTRVFH
jgi:hypothetical protein